MERILPSWDGLSRWYLRDAEGLSGCALKRFLVEDRRMTQRSTRITAVLAGVLVPFFSILDYFAYPEHFDAFLLFQILCTLSVGAAGCVALTRWGKAHYRAFAVLMPLIPAFFIALMVYCTGDSGTPYYAGLGLCLFAIGIIFHWSVREALLLSGTVLAMYFAACLPSLFVGVGRETIAGFVNNSIFLASTGAVVTCGSLSTHRMRVREFRNRDRLRMQGNRLALKNEELQATLRELRETERQLIQSEKMASLGQLSAGVIHEIGNPLNFCIQAHYLLNKRLRKRGLESETGEIMGDLKEGMERIKEIVGELRDFSHKSGENTEVFTIEECVHSALRMLGKQIESSDTAISVEIGEPSSAVGVRNQITQVLMNLIHNAIQAAEPEKRPCAITIRSRQESGRLCLSVSDNGPGISPDVREKIFDPFFTTKEVGEGTGLALSICFRIVEAHGGTLRVESEADHGTTFFFSLPTAEVEKSSPTLSKPIPCHA